MTFDLSKIDWQKMAGLIPAVIQHAESKDVLMLGYMNQEALDVTLKSGRVTFWSRSKQRLWVKGETSGHFLLLKEIAQDCDSDSLLVTALPQGPTCHTGDHSCFASLGKDPLGFLGSLDALIESRFMEKPQGSYTTKLFASGLPRLCQKVGEEGVEVAIAALAESDEAFKGESADLIFHLLVLARAKGFSLRDIAGVLQSRQLRSP